MILLHGMALLLFLVLSVNLKAILLGMHRHLEHGRAYNCHADASSGSGCIHNCEPVSHTIKSSGNCAGLPDALAGMHPQELASNLLR